MVHIAIMKKSWGFLEKILSGEKTIESRWSKSRPPFWVKVAIGDDIYFKNSGELVTAMAVVDKIIQFDNLTKEKISKILEKYAMAIGFNHQMAESLLVSNKKYCLLIFLKNPQKVTPFQIDKTGFGAMAAWITTDNLERLLPRVKGKKSGSQ